MTIRGRVSWCIGVLLLGGTFTAPRALAHDDWDDWVAYCDEVEGSLEKLNTLLDNAAATSDGEMWDATYEVWKEVSTNYDQSGCA